MPLFNKFTTGDSRSRERSHMLSIIENLNNMLNTTRGFGSPLADFGIHDMSGHMSRHEMARSIITDVKECIELYEPRVQLEDIVFEDDQNPLRLSFTIKCTVRKSATSLHLMFDTVMGSVNVESPTED